MQIFKYIIKRILEAIPILILVSIISFFLIRLSPVDPLGELKLNPAISKATIEHETKRLGLDKPIIVQYAYWAKSFLSGDLGTTTSGESVAQKLKERTLNTLLLSVLTIFFTWFIGIPLGILSALKFKKLEDKGILFFATIGMAIPSFFLGILCLIFAQKTGLFPIGNLTSSNFQSLSLFGKFLDMAHHLILPVFVLTVISTGSLIRQMRANLLDVLNSDYIKFARAKGLDENKVIIKHALRNAINPLITLLGFEFAGLLSGAALTEYIFQYPGLGRLVLEAVMKSDINLVMASLMIGSFMLILGNLIADILLKITDPRTGG